MIKIAVVDDDANEREQIKSNLKVVAEKEKTEYEIYEFGDGFSFLDNYRSNFDLVFMDIEMPGMDGIDVAKQMRLLDESAVLIFVTNMAQLAIKGYEVEALDFIVKPINKYNFAMKVSKVFARISSRIKETVQIKMDGETYNVEISSIRYLEIDGHFVVYHCAGKEYREYSTLKDAEKKINKPVFVKCNRCYLVNLNYVGSINKNYVTVAGAELLISRPQKKEFLSALADFYAGRIRL